MYPRCSPKCVTVVVFLSALWFLMVSAEAQLTDLTQAPNADDAGIHKSLEEQIGVGRGDTLTPDSSLFLIPRDPSAPSGGAASYSNVSSPWPRGLDRASEMGSEHRGLPGDRPRSDG